MTAEIQAVARAHCPIGSQKNTKYNTMYDRMCVHVHMYTFTLISKLTHIIT